MPKNKITLLRKGQTENLRLKYACSMAEGGGKKMVERNMKEIYSRGRNKPCFSL